MAQSPSIARDVPLLDLPLTGPEVERSAQIDFTVSRDAEIPVGTQLDWKLRAMIARGILREGDRLPSVRELAAFAGVNVNTVRSVYLALEEQGLLVSEHGRGTYVGPSGRDSDALADLVSATLERAAEAGIDPAELARSIWAAGEAASAARLPEPPLPPIDPEAGAPTLRRELRAQIGRIEAELALYAWQDRRSPPPERVETAIPVGRVASVEELTGVRDELIERLTRLRGEAERQGSHQARTRRHLERMVGDPAAHRWEMVTSDELGDPGCRNWRVVPRFGPLGAIMGWWRVKVSSGCP